MLPELNEASSSQAKLITFTKEECQQIMDYEATCPNSIIRFYASDVALNVDSDASCLVMSNAKSRMSRCFKLASDQMATPHQKLNSAILVFCKSLRHVVGSESESESETTGVFLNSQTTIPMRHVVEAICHPQPPTLFKNDNSTTMEFVRKNQ